MRNKSFTRLKTERLIIRRFRDSDLESFVACRNDPAVAHYQSWDSCSEQEAKDMILTLKREQPGVPVSGTSSP